MAAAESVRDLARWREPTKDQWYAFGAAWCSAGDQGHRDGARSGRGLNGGTASKTSKASSDKPGGAFFVASRAPGSCATGR